MKKTKKMYWLVESNDQDLSVTTPFLDNAKELIEGDAECRSKKELKETEYTLTPVWYTDDEYENLPEAN